MRKVHIYEDNSDDIPVAILQLVGNKIYLAQTINYLARMLLDFFSYALK
jgi:hypothetical protein